MNHVDWCRDYTCQGCQEETETFCARCGHVELELGAKVFIGDQELSLCHGCEEVHHRCYEEYLAESIPTGGDRTNSSTPTGSDYLAELTAHVRNARQ